VHYFYGGHSTPKGQPPLVSFSSSDLTPLKTAFNDSASSVCVVAVLSPTERFAPGQRSCLEDQDGAVSTVETVTAEAEGSSSVVLAIQTRSPQKWARSHFDSSCNTITPDSWQTGNNMGECPTVATLILLIPWCLPRGPQSTENEIADLLETRIFTAFGHDFVEANSMGAPNGCPNRSSASKPKCRGNIY
jgi:hypothetical protein